MPFAAPAWRSIATANLSINMQGVLLVLWNAGKEKMALEAASKLTRSPLMPSAMPF